MPRDTDRSSIYTETGRLGFLYCLVNKHMPGLVKVGATRKHPLQRASELGAGTGVPEGFQLAYYRDFDDSFLAETLVHQRFADARVNQSREFFRVPLGEVVAFIDTLATSVDYCDQLASRGVVGGEYRPVVDEVATPWADLFATFTGEGDTLNAEEQAACRALEARLR